MLALYAVRCAGVDRGWKLRRIQELDTNWKGEDTMGEYVQEHSDNGNGAGEFLAGLLLGGLVGMGAMLLVAPHSGKETRAVIRQEGVELRDRTAKNVEGAVAQVRGKARQITASARKKAKELQRDGQDMLDEQRERASTVVKAAKEAIQGS
jgi:gas vesicle protein